MKDKIVYDNLIEVEHIYRFLDSAPPQGSPTFLDSAAHQVAENRLAEISVTMIMEC